MIKQESGLLISGLIEARIGDKVIYAQDQYDALVDADALILLTEWNEFREPDFEKLLSLMKTPVIFDGRNIYDGKKLKGKSFDYFGIGIKHKT